MLYIPTLAKQNIHAYVQQCATYTLEKTIPTFQKYVGN